MQNMYWNYGWEFGYHTTGKITEQTDEVIHKAIIEFKNKMSELGFNVVKVSTLPSSSENANIGSLNCVYIPLISFSILSNCELRSFILPCMVGIELKYSFILFAGKLITLFVVALTN